MITLEILKAICPAVKGSRLATIVDPLDQTCTEFEINTELRASHFIAQIVHESGGFTYLREIANGKAYEGRVNLGNTEPGDGPRFKGWGWMQTTGRKNTLLVSQRLYGDDRLVFDPKLIDPPSLELAFRAAGDFWTIGAGQNLNHRAIDAGVPEGVNLNDLADKDDLELITLAINGGTNGITDRRAYFNRATEAFA